MSFSIARLRSAWADLRMTPPGDREYRALRIRSTGGTAIYAAIRELDGSPSVIFEGDLNIAPAARTRFVGEGISFHDDRDRQSRTYRLVATLESDAFEDLFDVLTSNLFQVAEADPRPAESLDNLRRRIEAWMTFLRRRSPGLSLEEVIGLYGELTFLGIALTHLTARQSVHSWMGPNRSLHDFMGDAVAVEVKTILGVSSIVHISGLGQLDDVGLNLLVLAMFRLAQDTGGQSLRELVAATRERIGSDDRLLVAEFDAKVLAYGYVEGVASDALDVRYTVRDRRFLRVADGFPRLIPGAVPIEVRDAAYSLDLAACDRFALAESEIKTCACGLGDLGRE